MIPKQAFFNYLSPLILGAWTAGGNAGTPPVIWAIPNAPEPLAPAFILRATLTKTPDQSCLGDVDDDGNQTVNDQAEATVTITCVGPGTIAVLEDIATSCRKPSIIRLATTQGIALVDRPRVTDVSGLLNRIQMEERGQLVTTIRFVNTVTDNVGWIEEVNMQGTYTDSLQPGNVQDITVNITTP